MPAFRSLPKPDRFGNYWFGKAGECVPAILPRLTGPNKGKRWFVSTGENGVIWSGTQIKEYDSLMMAMDDLQPFLPPL